MTRSVSIRPATGADRASILEVADRLAAFGPTTRTANEITTRERRALEDALDHPTSGSALFVADRQPGIVGILLLNTRHDYFTDEAHGHISILAVAREAEGQGVGRALLDAADRWGREQGFRRLTLAVFADNVRAKNLYARQGWRAELETLFKEI